MNERQQLGVAGEEFARAYLRSCLGWDIVLHNWRCPAGELDIVALDQDCLVVVEVRTRRGVDPGSVIEAISEKKVRQIYRVVQFLLAHRAKEWTYASVRVDAIAIRIQQRQVCELIHVRNALAVDELYL